MVARIWKGTVRAEDGDSFAAVILDTGFAEYAESPGNRGAWLLRRDGANSTEFLAISVWESLDAIRAFVGDDPESSKNYPEDERYLIDPPQSTSHYDVAAASAPSASA